MSRPARHQARWTPEQDRIIVERYDELSAREIGDLIGRTENAVKQRASMHGLRKDDNPHPNTGEEIERQDQAFVAAMTAACEAGNEHAPIGVDTTPGTARPRFYPYRERPIPTNSPAAECCD